MRGLRPLPAALVGAAAVGLITLVGGVFVDRTGGHAALALLLVVPVMLTATVGGQKPALFVSLLAVVALVLLVPPIGTLRITFAEDSVAIVVFAIVVFVIGGLVAHRVDGLAQVERQRAALLRSVSHDLRTPLATISAAISELEDAADGAATYDEPARRRMLRLIGDETERLDRLVGNLLSLARIEAMALAPRRQAIDIGELLHESVHRLDRVLTANSVVLDVSADLPLVHADHTLLEQLVANLVENAVRHSPPGAPIEISARAERGALSIVVSDSGPGVSPEEADAVFEPFRSGHMAGASGIGLAICRAVAEAHEGTISVGESPRGGASFTVVIPVR